MTFTRRSQTNGSVLLVALALLLSGSLAALYLLARTEKVHSLSHCVAQARISALKEASTQASLLNELALNNMLIMESLKAAREAWFDTLLSAQLAAVSRPYWQTSLAAENDERQALQSLKRALQSKATRGFLLAEALTLRNREIQESVRSIVTLNPQSTAATFCFVLETSNSDATDGSTTLLTNTLFERFSPSFLPETSGCALILPGGETVDFEWMMKNQSSTNLNFGLFLLANHEPRTWKVSPKTCRYPGEESFFKGPIMRWLQQILQIDAQTNFTIRFEVALSHPLLPSSVVGASLVPNWTGVIRTQFERGDDGNH